MGNYCLMDTELLFGMMKVLEIEIMAIVLSGTELIYFKMTNVLACMLLLLMLSRFSCV